MLMSRALEGFVYGVTATDALTFVATPSGIVVVAVVASLIPAARASRVDPASVLRDEL
jgi:putative ABC transport system permease protein